MEIMTTFGDAFEKKGRDSQNNFLILRLVAASMVIYGHGFALAAPCDHCHDVVTRLLHYRYSGDLALHIFFVISGFLVTSSFDNRHNLFDFLKSRMLRIFPALIVCVFVLIVLGAYLSTLSLSDYFRSSETQNFFFINSSLYSYYDKLPGVFEHNKYGPAADGSLWTLWIEFRLYLMVALFGTFGFFKNRIAINTV